MTTVTTGMAQPRLEVLGRFALTLPLGQPAAVSRSSQRLLAYLAVSRGPVDRALLSQRLWADSDDAHASSNLRSALWRLSRLADKPLVSVTTQGVRLSPDVRVDLWDSETYARALVHSEPTRNVHQDTVALFEDDLLLEWSEEWLDIEQETYRQLRLHALEEHSRLLCDQGRYSAALAAALRAVRGEPLRESAHRCVVAVHLAEGNPAEALRQFHTLPADPRPRARAAPFAGDPGDGARAARTPAGE